MYFLVLLGNVAKSFFPVRPSINRILIKFCSKVQYQNYTAIVNFVQMCATTVVR